MLKELSLRSETDFNQVYEEGISLLLDSFAHSYDQDILYTKDARKRKMYYGGKFENKETTLHERDHFKLIVHDANEIPLFLGPNKQIAELSGSYDVAVGEVFIPLQEMILVHLEIIVINSMFKKFGKQTKIVRKNRQERESMRGKNSKMWEKSKPIEKILCERRKCRENTKYQQKKPSNIAKLYTY